MKQLSWLNPKDSELLSGLNNNSPFQFLPGFSKIYKEYSGEKVFLIYSENLKAFLPIRLFTSHFIKFIQILHAPIRDNKELNSEEQLQFFNEFIEYCKTNNLCERLVQPHPYGILSAIPNGSKYCEFGTYITDLATKSDEEIFKQFHPKYQKAIHHTEKSGGVVKFGIEVLEDFYKCYEHTMRKAGAISENIQYFKAYCKYLGSENATPAVVYDNGNPVGGIFVVHTNYSALCTHAGSMGDTKLYGSMKYLHFEMMKRMKSLGVKKYDLVGVRIGNNDPALEGIFRFKKGFGGELKKGYLWKIDIDPLKTRVYDFLLKLRHPGNLYKDIIDQVNLSSSRGMHILIIPSWYKSITEPVLGTFFEEQARTLMKAGHKVGIIYPQFASVSSLFQKKDEIVSFVDDNGLPTYSMVHQAYIPKMRKLSYRIFNEAVQRIYNKYTQKYGIPDIIHAHSIFHGGMAGYYIAKNNHLPFVITEHLTSFMTGDINHPEDIELSGEIFCNADAALIVSKNFKNDIENSLHLRNDTFKVIPNLVADIFFDDFKIKTYQNGETFVFFTNSFLLPRKNHKLIFNALEVLLKKGVKNFELRVGGDGPLRNSLQTIVKECGLDNYVKFLGALSRQQVKTEASNCHCFLLTSTYETFGVVLIESLASGRPVITTDSGGPRDFINSTNGIILKEQTPECLAEAMIQMMQNYKHYNQEQLSKDCRQLFSEQKIEGDIEQMYRKVLAEFPNKTRIVSK